MKVKEGDNGTGSRLASDRGVAEPQVSAEAENLERVRDILFGGFAREFERRLKQLDEHVERHAATLTDRLDRTESALELRAEQILDEFTGRLQAEAEERTQVFQTLSQGVQELSTRLEAQAKAMDEHLAATRQGAEAALDAQAKALGAQIAATARDLQATLEGMHAQLRREKVDRSSLAELLTNLSAELVGKAAPAEPAADGDAAVESPGAGTPKTPKPTAQKSAPRGRKPSTRRRKTG